MIDTHDKYITFKRDEFVAILAPQGWSVTDIDNVFTPIELEDAVVIRRQDLFASPALATYAACIAIAGRLVGPPIKKQLLEVADYFEQQAKLAADEGYKLPDV